MRKGGDFLAWVVGLLGDTDQELLSLSSRLYRQYRLTRAYYSGFSPVIQTPFENLPATDPLREHRLYQASFLLRDYGWKEEATLPPLDFNQELVSAGELIGMAIGAFQPEEQERPTTLAHYLEALHRRDQSILAWEQFFAEWDVLLCPPSMVAAFPHCEPGSPLHVDDQEVVYWMVSAHSTVFNYTGHPAVVLPYKLDRAGLPIGVQLVGKRWHESRLLAMAKAFSEVTGAFQRPPGY